MDGCGGRGRGSGVAAVTATALAFRTPSRSPACLSLLPCLFLVSCLQASLSSSSIARARARRFATLVAPQAKRPTLIDRKLLLLYHIVILRVIIGSLHPSKK